MKMRKANGLKRLKVIRPKVSYSINLSTERAPPSRNFFSIQISYVLYTLIVSLSSSVNCHIVIFTKFVSFYDFLYIVEFFNETELN